MEMLLDMVNQNNRRQSRNSKIKKIKKTQKQINEHTGALKKYQSETDDTINREINEFRKKIDNIRASDP
jgi:regulatory protein YycH of two-component signal transduction system YycFG